MVDKTGQEFSDAWKRFARALVADWVLGYGTWKVLSVAGSGYGGWRDYRQGKVGGYSQPADFAELPAKHRPKVTKCSVMMREAQRKLFMIAGDEWQAWRKWLKMQEWSVAPSGRYLTLEEQLIYLWSEVMGYWSRCRRRTCMVLLFWGNGSVGVHGDDL